MQLLEYEAKKLLSETGLKTPSGFIFKSTEELRERIGKLDFPIMLKAQVPILGRGAKGGIKKASSKEEALIEAEKLFNEEFNGLKPKLILAEEFIPHERELYLSLIVSGTDRRVVVMASKHGGLDVEEVHVLGKPVYRVSIDPLIGLTNPQALRIAAELGFNGKDKFKMGSIIEELYSLMVKRDLKLLEINPLAINLINGEVYALDVKIDVDEDASFRQPETFESKSMYITSLELNASEHGFSYVPLDGEIAVIGNGAGLVMATIDLITHYGGKPLCFIDIGGGASSERVMEALKLSFKGKPKAILLNVFAGVTRCDEVAEGVIEAMKAYSFPRNMIVVRLTGTREEEGREKLEKAGISCLSEMEEAVKKVVELASK